MYEFSSQIKKSELEKNYQYATAEKHPILIITTPKFLSVARSDFGIIILESFIQKTPVIVHELGALPEVVAQSQGGRTYSNPEELIRAMEEFRTNPELRSRLGANGHQAWRKYWSEDAHLEMYFRLLDETARRKWDRVPWDNPMQSDPALREVAVGDGKKR